MEPEIIDIQPEIIDENYTPPMEESGESPVELEMPPEQEKVSETPPSILPPEKIKEIAEQMVTSITGVLEEKYRIKLGEKDKELEDRRIGFDEELSKRDEEKMSMEETHKSMSKEMEAKHKEMMKAKDTEMKEMQKTMKGMEKKMKDLLAQVTEALNEED